MFLGKGVSLKDLEKLPLLSLSELGHFVGVDRFLDLLLEV